jgi:hypothetical protein
MRRVCARGSVLRGAWRPLLGLVGLALGLGGASALAAAPPGVREPGVPSPVPPPRPLRATIVSRTTAGPALTLTIACKDGAASEVCTGPITLTANEGQKVGSASYSVATGVQASVTIPLNAAGGALLTKHYKLAATLSLAGTTTLTRTVDFHYARITSPVAFTFEFTASHTTIRYLTVSNIPEGGVVDVICHGGGCPFASRAFSPSGGQVALTPSLKGSPLRPRSTLDIEVTATNQVGKVAIFETQSGAQPTLTEQCLPPGASSPLRCA